MNEQEVISDFELMKIPVIESKESLVSLRDYSKDIIIEINSFSREYENLKEDECFIRESVAIMLSQAQSLLHKSIKIKVIDGFRSLDTQKKLYKLVFEEIKEKNQSMTKEELILETDKWVANPETIPPHTTGAAVDITLVDVAGKELPMGSEINSISEKAHTICNGLTEEEQKNRSLLIDLMKKVGFTNYPLEWWHWSYGDRMWAYYSNNKQGIYNAVKKHETKN